MFQTSTTVKVDPEEDEQIPTYDYSRKIKQETVDIERKIEPAEKEAKFRLDDVTAFGSCKSAFVEESKSPNEKRKFLCEMCQQKFSHKQSLQRHLKFHSPNNPYQCKYCKDILQNKAQREQHVKDRHCEGDDGFSCKICKRKYPQLKNFDSHMMRHLHKLGSFSCEICHQQFTREIIFKKHLNRHKGANLFACKMCQMKFTDNPTLQKHIKSHAEEKQFSCEICAKKFLRKIDALNHLNNHANIDQFQCKYCKIVYSLKKSLHNHIIETHWNEISNL